MARVRSLRAGSICARINVESCGINIHENWQGAAVANAVGGGDVGMADGDDFVPRAHAHRQQCQVQSGRAARNRAGVRRAHEAGELALKRRHLRALRDPA